MSFMEDTETGHANAGGTRSHTFAKGGGTLCSRLRPTLIFALFAPMVRQ
jgi:hypothetical protein